MSIILLAYLPGILGICAVAYLVFARRSQNSLAYGAFCLTLTQIALWLLFQMISLLVPNSSATLMVNISLVFSNLMVAFFMIFAIAYQAPIAKRKSIKLMLPVIILPAIVISAFCLSPLIIESVINDGLRQEIVPGPLYVVQTVYIVGYVLTSLWFLGRRVSALKGKNKSAQILLMMGFGVAVAINLVANYVFGLPQDLTQYLLPTSIFITVAIIGYAIAKHGLFDIRLAAVRSAAYVLSIITLAAIYYAIAYFFSVVLFRGEVNSAVSISPVNIGLALALAFIFQPIKDFFDKITDKIFYRDRYSIDDFYAKLNEALTSTIDLRGLLENTSRQIGEMLKSEQAAFFVRYNDTQRVSAGTVHHTSLSEQDAHHLDEYIEKMGNEVIVTELLPDNGSIRRLLTSRKIAILMPLTNRGIILGYLALGGQRTGNYTNRDIKVLKTVSDELVIAIQNALSVQEVRDINVHLQQRINAATKELKASNTQLKRLDEAKDEFLSMASHQLRTPLTSVKGFISMVIDGDLGPISPQQQKVLEQAFDSSQRMVFLISDFLNVSRIQSGKFVIDKIPFDIVKLVHEEVDQLKDNAKTRGLEFVYEPPAHMPEVYADKDKLRQVMMNFMDNALYYSPKGGKVTIRLYKDASGIVFKVIDSGIGVPKEEQEKLFTKFFRAKNAQQQRPDGTGIGLYMAKKVIVGHEGSLIFESKEGKGSTFGFRLPLKNDLK